MQKIHTNFWNKCQETNGLVQFKGIQKICRIIQRLFKKVINPQKNLGNIFYIKQSRFFKWFLLKNLKVHFKKHQEIPK